MPFTTLKFRLFSSILCPDKLFIMLEGKISSDSWQTFILYFFFFFSAVPSAPIGPLEISNVTVNSADLEWKKPKSDGGLPITGYIIENRTATRTTWGKCGNVDGKTLTFTATGLLEDTEYIFRVSAVNDEGVGAPLEATDTTKPTRKIRKTYLMFYFIPI